MSLSKKSTKFSGSGGGGGSSLPVVDTTAIVSDPGDSSKLVRLDAGAVPTATTVAIQAAPTNCRIRDCIKFEVYGSADLWSLNTYWLGHVPAQFKIESISGISYDSSGTSATPTFTFKVDGSIIATVGITDSMTSGNGKFGTTANTNMLSAGNVMAITITDTGEGSAGSAAAGLSVNVIGHWVTI